MSVETKANKDYPCIVVLAHDRPLSLKRLLNSLNSAKYPGGEVELFISIDHGKNEEVIALAENFHWKYGTKNLIIHPENLGLKGHVLFAGDLSIEKKRVLILEDDLMVSPYFFKYARKAIRFYEKNEKIAGISLYSYQVSENGHFPFVPYDDGYSNYFIQAPSSWGQVWTAKQWEGFRIWQQNEHIQTSEPNFLNNWGEQSWKKEFFSYLIQKNKYFVFPRKSLSTNFEDRGTHADSKGLFQVPLLNFKLKYNFSQPENSFSIYDAWFEMKAKCLKKLCPTLMPYNFELDLFESKTNFEKVDYVLGQTRGKEAEMSFGAELIPLISNVIFEVPGHQIQLQKKEHYTIFEKPEPLFAKHQGTKSESISSQNKTISFNVVVPILGELNEEVLMTLRSLEKQVQKSWTCLLVCKSNSEDEIEQFLRQHKLGHEFSFISYAKALNRFDLVFFGFNQMQGDFLLWVNPGTMIGPNFLNAANTILKTFSQVKWLKPYQFDQDLIRLRVNQGILNQSKKKFYANMGEEGSIFDRLSWKTTSQRINSSQEIIESDFFENLLTSHYCYIGIDEAMKFEKSKIQKEKSIHKNYRIRLSIISRIFALFYTQNIPYLRSFYGLYHNLNDVIRKDTIHNTYYFDRY